MEIIKSSGKYQIIDSGLIIADTWESDIEFHVNASKIFQFDIIVHFEENDDGKRDFSKVVNENIITFNCINFEDTTGTSCPIEVATFANKKIYFSFRNYGQKDVMRKIEYTFYIEK